MPLSLFNNADTPELPPWKVLIVDDEEDIHKDIGTIGMLKDAQLDNCDLPFWMSNNSWQEQFTKHLIHKEIKEII